MPELPTLEYEKKLWKQKTIFVAGIDEAGRGSWAGPVTAAAVILPPDPKIFDILYGVCDSKQMTSRQRDYWKDVIREIALSWAIGWATVHEIDCNGILAATRLAMIRAVRKLKIPPGHLLIDAVQLSSIDTPQTSLIKGDVHVLSISAASILAKTARDERMIHLAQTFPGYGFEKHKGYGTTFHQVALAKFGPCKVHRRSFSPVQNWNLMELTEHPTKSPPKALDFIS